MKTRSLTTKTVVLTFCLFTLTAAAHAQHRGIGHVVIIFMENRTPDNLFQDPNLIANGADIASSGTNSQGQNITLTPIPLANNYDLSHTHAAFVAEYDDGRMNGADKVPVTCNKGAPNCPPANPQFKYVNPSDVQPYFQLAEQYTFADRMFQTNQGPSLPAHQFIISGTSAPTTYSDLFDAENANGVPNANNNTGCTAPPKEYVMMIDPYGNESSQQYPCFEHPTLTDSLDYAGVSWTYYTPAPNNLWTGPNAIKHIRLGPDWQYVNSTANQIFTDINNYQLPQVSWVIPDGKQSDHPGSNAGEGPSWVASLVNAIGSSYYWNDTVIFITWDDWGGWFDHVAPQVVNDGYSWGSGYVYGLRVPLIIVSPYVKQGYISHVTHDFGSILRFIEENYNLPSLGYADAYADDFSDCFYFGHHNEFKQIQAPLKADYFINDKRPPVDPDDD
jgi:phospholipase C